MASPLTSIYPSGPHTCRNTQKTPQELSACSHLFDTLRLSMSANRACHGSAPVAIEHQTSPPDLSPPMAHLVTTLVGTLCLSACLSYMFLSDATEFPMGPPLLHIRLTQSRIVSSPMNVSTKAQGQPLHSPSPHPAEFLMPLLLHIRLTQSHYESPMDVVTT
jgi:hypothetical protein